MQGCTSPTSRLAVGAPLACRVEAMRKRAEGRIAFAHLSTGPASSHRNAAFMSSPPSSSSARVGVIMGSTSDWDTMRAAVEMLERFGVPCEREVISAHRAPERLREYAQSARSRGLQCIIAGAGGAAHLAGVTAAMTDLPVLGVPMESAALKGLDSLLSIVQMPGGIPVATFAIGKAGATNAALFAVAMLGLADPTLAKKLVDFRADQTQKVLAAKLP
jgi:5-(carboxyamino)imidazole ribonucleotide mutase